MPSPTLGSSHVRTTSGNECHYCLWTSSHSRTASGVACHHRPWTANTVERCWAWHSIIAFGQHKRSNDVRCGMTSSPFDSIHDRITSGVACHHLLWTAHTVERHQAWHAIIPFGWQRRSNNVTRGMPSPPLDNAHGRTTSGVVCHHGLWTAHTVERHQAWQAIIALRWQTRSNNVRRGMPSSPLN